METNSAVFALASIRSIRWPGILFALLLLNTAATAGNTAESQPRSPEEELKALQAADGLQVELVAAEPLVSSPCALAFDERGRLYVAENRGYPIGPAEGQPAVGTIALLEDTQGDGRMDKRTTFAEGLTFPNGVLPWMGGLIVTCAPDVLFLQDTDGDGVADVRRVLLTGFETTKSTQLRVNKPTLGPDGWIYFAAGLAAGTITSPEHPELPPLKMTGDLRWNPRTGEYQNVDGRSQYGLSFDEFGRRFICMNRIQVQHVVLSSRDLRRNPNFAFSDTVQNCPELIPNKLMHSTGGAARIYPISSNITTADSHMGTFSAACGIMIWRGGALPHYYRGAALSCDPTGNLVHVDRLDPKGVSFAAVPLLDQKELLASRDDWTRPVFLESGPDGALYVCDMYRRVIEHPDYLPQEIRKHTNFEGGKDLGRIWRVRQNGEARQARVFNTLPPIASRPGENGLGLDRDLIQCVATEDGWRAATAFRLLAERHDASLVEFMRRAMAHATLNGRVALLRLMFIQDSLRLDDLKQALVDPSSQVKTAALLLARERPDWAQAALGVLLPKPTPWVELQRALLLPQASSETELVRLLNMVSKPDSDRWQEAAVLSTCRGKAWELVQAALRRPALQQDLQPGFLRQLGRLVALEQVEMTPTLLVSSLPLQDNVRLPLVAGFCEVRRKGPAKELLDPADAPTAALLRGAVQMLAGPIEETKRMKSDVRVEGVAGELAVPGVAEAEEAVAVLAFAPWQIAREPLLRTASDRARPALAEAALRALSQATAPEVAQTLLQKERWASATPGEREATLGALLSQPQHLGGILDAIERQDIPANAIPTVRRAAFEKSKDPAVRERAAKLFNAAAGDRQKVFEAAKEALTLAPKAEHGHQLFLQNCSTCHRLNQEGSAVGPDLFDIRNQPKENILFHIIIPDAEIAPNFTAYLAETKDGRTLAGLLASETPTSVTLRMPLAQQETILRTNLTKLTALPNSLMPTGLDAAMSKQDLADLLAFLKGEQ